MTIFPNVRIVREYRLLIERCINVIGNSGFVTKTEDDLIVTIQTTRDVRTLKPAHKIGVKLKLTYKITQ
jgi:hypothetical protein